MHCSVSGEFEELCPAFLFLLLSKCSKYFLQLENKNYKSKYIKKLHIDNEIITSPETILDKQKEFYKELYSEKDNSKNCIDCSLFSETDPKLDIAEQQICDKPLTIKECYNSLQELPNNKSPGSDGFTSDFYKYFWSDIKDILLDSFCYSFRHNILSSDQRRAVLTLLPKPNKDV